MTRQHTSVQNMSTTDESAASTRAANPFAEGAAFIDGAFTPIHEARLPLLDWGFIRGDANQDTISCWKGMLFRLEDHLDRFFRNIGSLRMTCPLTRDEVRDVAVNLVRKSGLREAYVQLIMTRGAPPIGSRDPRDCVNRFQAYCIPYVWIATLEKQKTGLSMHVSDRWRVPTQSVSPLLKHYHWLDFEMSLFDAYDRGAETACCIDADGNIAEGPGFNVFAIIDGVVRTPKDGVLDGMTRRTAIELCEEQDQPWDYGYFTVEDVQKNASEMFITSTSGGIIPITTVNGVKLGDGAPGPVTRTVHDAYWSKREAGWLATPVDYASDQTHAAEKAQ